MKGEPLSSVLEPAVETPMVGKSVITLDDLSIRQIQEMLHKAQYIDSHRKEVAHTCEGRVLATLFYEPSTRTRLSFETAMLRLGGKVIGFAGAQLASVTKGETIELRFEIIPEGNYANTLYTIRYFQYDGEGTLKLVDGPVLVNNDRVLLESKTFRLNYTAKSADAHKFLVVIQE